MRAAVHPCTSTSRLSLIDRRVPRFFSFVRRLLAGLSMTSQAVAIAATKVQSHSGEASAAAGATVDGRGEDDETSDDSDGGFDSFLLAEAKKLPRRPAPPGGERRVRGYVLRLTALTALYAYGLASGNQLAWVAASVAVLPCLYLGVATGREMEYWASGRKLD